jgi:hypothetical protein
VSDEKLIQVVRAARYILWPGEVTSSHDGGHRFLDGQQLMKLYGLQPRDCTIAAPGDKFSGSPIKQNQGRIMIHLFPRDRGDYAAYLMALLRQAARNL